MSKQFPDRRLSIRPLSEGIGLGSLQTPRPMETRAVHEPGPARPVLDPSLMRQAHSAYAPHSVATEIKGRSSTKAYVTLVTIATGVGLDLVIGLVSAFMFAWCGMLAWNAGAGSEFSPVEALRSLGAFVAGMPLVISLAVAILAGVIVRIFRKFS